MSIVVLLSAAAVVSQRMSFSTPPLVEVVASMVQEASMYRRVSWAGADRLSQSPDERPCLPNSDLHHEGAHDLFYIHEHMILHLVTGTLICRRPGVIKRERPAVGARRAVAPTMRYGDPPGRLLTGDPRERRG
ncbi:hypothetical protein [Micromonospora sp. C95]|uniref:hypothetical protein n=1 Tax=Micromonospora sp. C95 TaxID=2824882 RepID=UPI001B387EB2|nr:hypothetical protein [Micromonospora sp. C95]MBQ1026108.1 hypothetical protein [Micromonospora sp. C95]